MASLRSLPGWDAYRTALSTRIIARWEGVRLRSYLCPAMVWTVGAGSVCRHPDGRMMTAKDPDPCIVLASEEEALALLAKELRTYTAAVDAMTASTDLSPPQSAALVSLAYNIGTGALRASTLLRKVKARDWDAVPGQFRRWVYAGGRRLRGLALRREAEARLFMRGTESESE